eukprot:CAMPEP_0113846442 /NCGR_PEP_ID=MMETSP0372-20130328/1310_1 /TAXON_ID=340204 /ORGANISM="Lankesteria abbotti" /LENGTH=398 /DNA_ID=CAMNT_0000815587 /DNA_START=93 /DNA_END=1289 /DNA_ORIENTATION=- /assembly_acc=CAM_ASM_000359
MLRGLKEVETELAVLGIQFHLLRGNVTEVLPKFVDGHSVGMVVCDFSPLRIACEWSGKLSNTFQTTGVKFVQVDAHNVVPVWLASEKQEVGARTLRPKIHKLLAQFLVSFPKVCGSVAVDCSVDWSTVEESLDVDMSVAECSIVEPGTQAGLVTLQKFCTEKLKTFATNRNNPTIDVLSNLSPYFHFGQISAQRAVLVVNEFRSKHPDSVAAFVEETVIRRELAENFCYYNPNYDNLLGASDWARTSLDLHRSDKREFLYSLDEFERAETHDHLWNAAQRQMTQHGKMHGFLRMYWAKKILEWSESPEQALQCAIYLNDKYELDGRDPCGYVGCMWAICGVHDQGWAERPVFGKIRFMNYKGCQRKFDVAAFERQYGQKKRHLQGPLTDWVGKRKRSD